MAETSDYFSVSEKRKVKLLSQSTIFAKLLLGYVALYVLSFALGGLVFYLLDAKNSLVLNARIISYFNTEFLVTDSIFDKINLLVDISGTDITYLILLFIAGFTMLTGVIVSLSLVFRGFCFGFSVSYFIFAIKCNYLLLPNNNLSFIVFSFVGALSTSIMIYFSVKTTCFSYDFRALDGITRKIIKSKALYAQLYRFLIAFGALLILNLIRCIV